MARHKDERARNEDAIRAGINNLLSAKPAPSKHKHRERRTSAGLWVRPFHSDALGVHPEQVEEARAALREQGVMADFDSEGRCIITSDKQYREVAKACGMWTGRDGFSAGQDEEGNRILSGRQLQEGKASFRRAVERGDYD